MYLMQVVFYGKRNMKQKTIYYSIYEMAWIARSTIILCLPEQVISCHVYYNTHPNFRYVKYEKKIKPT